MDLDISDILADVSRPLHPFAASNFSGTTDFPLDSTTSYADHQLLVRAWTSERCSPSLLPYAADLVSRTTARIRTQIARIEDMTAGVTPGAYHTTTTTTSNPPSAPANTNLILSILQTDLSRTQFIVRSYLRQRLAKLTRHAEWYLQHHCDDPSLGSSPSSPSDALLSPTEQTFLRNHQALLARFYDDSFLAAFPTSLRRLDDRSGGVDLVEGPGGEGVVIVRCLKGEWGNRREVDDGREGGGREEEEGLSAQNELRMRGGEVWVVRWRDVRTGVVDGDLELL